nr:hypothetical protein [Rhizobium leguminosarum]
MSCISTNTDCRSLSIFSVRMASDIAPCDFRTDRYGIRTVLTLDGQPIRFEIVREARKIGWVLARLEDETELRHAASVLQMDGDLAVRAIAALRGEARRLWSS